jgi:ATP:ADP antiporter, AAA family
MMELRPSEDRPGVLDRLFAPFTVLHAGESTGAALLMLSVFLLLTAYYVLKVVREPLILAAGGAELKSYTAAIQAVLLLCLIPAYGAIANRVNRIRLITVVTLFFISNLLLFYVLARAGAPGLGAAFFVWVGIFNMMIVAQFWSFANDVYTPEQGRRLFAIVGFGQTAGAIVGGVVAKVLLGRLGVLPLLFVAAAILCGYLLLVHAVHRRAQRGPRQLVPVAAEPMPDRRNGFAMLVHDRYLGLIALLLLALNFVNTNGEYILGRVVSHEAAQRAAAGLLGPGPADESVRQFIGGFYANYFIWVNAITAIVQLFLVSRILGRFGVRTALYVLPVVALGAYGILAFLPLLPLIRIAKISENSLDYSLNNTTRHALFLPTSRAAKYKAKAAIDTFVVRMGDVLSAGLVFIGTLLAMQPRDFAIVNLVLVVIWLVVVTAVGKEYRSVMAGYRDGHAGPG